MAKQETTSTLSNGCGRLWRSFASFRAASRARGIPFDRRLRNCRQRKIDMVDIVQISVNCVQASTQPCSIENPLK